MPRNYLPLNGRWQLAPGLRDSPPSQWRHVLSVPGLVDLAGPEYDWRSHEYHWYRTEFTLPSEDRTPLVILRIEQAMFGTAVWLNGVNVGCDIACYTSQEYDITPYIKYGAANELLVRVGAKSTLPPESAVGKDQERSEFIPGIWGDVYVVRCGNPRIKLVQVIPHIEADMAEARITVENHSDAEVAMTLNAVVLERATQHVVSSKETVWHKLTPHTEAVLTVSLPIENMQLWSAENPFLYELETMIIADEKHTDSVRTTFGMREFKIVGSDFYFNGKRIFLRGGNIAFHRFLSDADRGTLPWNPDWVKRLLIDIPKAHKFNFFRAHLGQMNNRWYDIADEYGMLLQNEWQFWTTTGTKEQITKEFTRWLQDNWNHPSIIIWDALNECSDDIVQKEIVPQMKRLDPTRPWESVDFVEEHPYIYSLGPVLNGEKFGFSRSLDDIEKSSAPSMVNEFMWWWLDKEWNPTNLTQSIVARWLGTDYTKDELIEQQSFLAQELVELFRRMRVKAIQPFVYLSNNDGSTANWFLGNIKDLQPKPVLNTLKNAFAPFGVSLELWDRHFVVSESVIARMFVLNDEPAAREGRVRYGVMNQHGVWLNDTSRSVAVEASGCSVIPIQVMLPRRPGEYCIRAELYPEAGDETLAYSEKIAHVFEPLTAPHSAGDTRFSVLADSDEIAEFLQRQGLTVESFDNPNFEHTRILIVGEGQLRDKRYQGYVRKMSQIVQNGGRIIIIEPEFGVKGKEEIRVLEDLSLTIERRADLDKGGYDSYIFAEDHQHPLWKGIEKKHLQMFNGGYGGEVVSQHDVTATLPHTVLARCGLQLKVPAVFEIPYGQGKAIVSRLQLRGRLTPRKGASGWLYARRVDPVLQRFLLNVLAYAVGD